MSRKEKRFDYSSDLNYALDHYTYTRGKYIYIQSTLSNIYTLIYTISIIYTEIRWRPPGEGQRIDAVHTSMYS